MPPSTGYDSATITNPASALTDFTVMVDLSRFTASWWAANDTADGTKGRAYKDDGTTELAVDWIDFNSGAETGWARVKWSGTLAASGTQIVRIYPPVAANSSVAASATYGSDNAYDANWWGYYPNGGITDRTSNGRDLTGSNITSGDSVGQVGAATEYNGTNSSASISSGVPAAYPFTFMGWGKVDAAGTGTGNVMVGWADSSVANMQHRHWWQQAGDLRSDSVESGTTATSDIALSSANVQNWNHWCSVFGAFNSREVFLNATSGGEDTTSNTPTNEDRICLGVTADSTQAGWFDGLINDVQMHDIARSADWIAQEHAQTDSQSTFWGTWAWTAAAASSAFPFQRYYAQTCTI